MREKLTQAARSGAADDNVPVFYFAEVPHRSVRKAMMIIILLGFIVIAVLGMVSDIANTNGNSPRMFVEVLALLFAPLIAFYGIRNFIRGGMAVARIDARGIAIDNEEFGWTQITRLSVVPPVIIRSYSFQFSVAGKSGGWPILRDRHISKEACREVVMQIQNFLAVRFPHVEIGAGSLA